VILEKNTKNRNSMLKPYILARQGNIRKNLPVPEGSRVMREVRGAMHKIANPSQGTKKKGREN